VLDNGPGFAFDEAGFIVEVLEATLLAIVNSLVFDGGRLGVDFVAVPFGLADGALIFVEHPDLFGVVNVVGTDQLLVVIMMQLVGVVAVAVAHKGVK